MSATLKHEETSRDCTTGTLGALLYADRAKERVPEGDWVALVESIAAGEQRALRALYDRTHRIVFTLVMRMIHNRESAEELTMDVYREAWQRASRYQTADGTVIGWIMNLARSRTIDRVRYEQRKKRVYPQLEASLASSGGDPCGDDFELERRGRALREALLVLTPAERQAIDAAFFSELTYAEAAKWLQQPLGTVKSRIRAGLTKLRIALISEGAGYDSVR